MTAQHFMQNPGEGPEDISGHVLLPGIGEDGFSVQTQAESGSVAGSTVLFDDPEGTFYPIGLNAYRVYETDSEGDDPLLFSGGFTIRREKRGTYRTGGSRIVEANMEDGNAGLSRFVVRADEDGDRPEETEEERMEWLFTTSGMALHWDFATSILDLGSTVMSKTDYTDQTLAQVLDDMAQQTGKNFYVYWDGSEGNPPEALLVYAFDAGTHLTSDLRFSNLEADVDDETTFYAGLDWELSIDPGRVASYVSVRYANGRVDESDSGTADEFSRIDKVMDGSHIKTAAAATARALQYLDELDSEELILTGTVYLPASKVSQFRAGMRAQMKATHLTGLQGFTWVRLLNVTHTQIATEEQVYGYACAFEGTFNPGSAPLSCAGVIVDIDTTVDGPLIGQPGSYSITPVEAGTGTFLAIAYITVGANGWFVGDGTLLEPAGTGWVHMEQQPAPMSVGHTIHSVGYRQDAAGAPGWSGGIGSTGGGAADGRHMGFFIQGATLVQVASAVGGLGGITWDDPLTPGNMVICLRTGEGPTGFSSEPNPVNTWTDIDIVLGNLESSGSSQEAWAICVTAENAEELTTGVAGSSWWATVFEVSF